MISLTKWSWIFPNFGVWLRKKKQINVRRSNSDSLFRSAILLFRNVVQARFIVHLSWCAIKIEPAHRRSNGVATWYSDKVISFHVKSKSSQRLPIVLNSIHLQFTLVSYLMTWDYKYIFSDLKWHILKILREEILINP